MRKVRLTRGLFAKVDDADYELVSRHRWFAGCGGKYACRMKVVDGRKTMIYMHRFLARPSQGLEVDHRNGDGLDNRRSNIRVCRQEDNARNRVERRDTWLPKGVVPSRHRFVAAITYRSIGRYLGTFDSASGAALAYSWACGKLFGEFYRTTPFEGRKA